MSIKKILVPVDFSPRCCWAVIYASNLALKFGADVVAIRVGEYSLSAKLETFLGAPSSGVRRKWATDLSESLGATLHIVHAVPAADETSDNRGEIDLRHYLFHRAEMEFVRLFGFTARVTLAGGGIAKVVRESALRERANVVVIAADTCTRASVSTNPRVRDSL